MRIRSRAALSSCSAGRLRRPTLHRASGTGSGAAAAASGRAHARSITPHPRGCRSAIRLLSSGGGSDGSTSVMHGKAGVSRWKRRVRRHSAVIWSHTHAHPPARVAAR
eukprot:scaffold2423_cov113-Isochrysis_galbana.AAC.18